MDERTQGLHGPWDQDPDGVELEKLRREHGDQWRIWRGLSEHREPTLWHASRTRNEHGDGVGRARDLSAVSGEGLRRQLEAQAARERDCA